MNYALLIGPLVVLILVILFLVNAIKVVREYQRLVVFPSVASSGSRGPGSCS